MTTCSAKMKIAAQDNSYAFSADRVDGLPSFGDSGGPIFCGGKLAGTTSCVTTSHTYYGDVQMAQDLNRDNARALEHTCERRWFGRRSERGRRARRRAMIVWTKQPGNALKGVRGPFVAHVTPKGDGRWNWQIFADEAPNPLAAGVSVSAGAAKTKCDQFIQRSGRV